MIFRSLAAALILGLSICPLLSQDDMSITNQKAYALNRKIQSKISANYLVFLPKDYKPKSRQRWPLMLFLHGAGERGTNIAKVTIHGPPKIVKKKADFPFIVVSPQCPSGRYWSNDMLLALLDEVTRKYEVDTNRVYLTGLSMGGYGTWSLGVAYPEKFAAIVPICGGGDIIGILLPDPAKARALKTLPVWAFHGAKDETVKMSESQRMIDALKRIGNDARLTIYDDAGHDSWTRTYDNSELYDWLLKQKR